MPPGSTQRARLGLGAQLLAGEPAGVAISSPSTVISVVEARAKKPTIRLAGNGHGWLPK